MRYRRERKTIQQQSQTTSWQRKERTLSRACHDTQTTCPLGLVFFSKDFNQTSRLHHHISNEIPIRMHLLCIYWMVMMLVVIMTTMMKWLHAVDLRVDLALERESHVIHVIILPWHRQSLLSMWILSFFLLFDVSLTIIVDNYHFNF